MSRRLRILSYTAGLLLIIHLTLVITGKTYVYTALYHNFADIDDHLIFDNHVVKAGKTIELPRSTIYNSSELPGTLTSVLDRTETVALVVLKGDSLVHEQYWAGYSDTSHSNVFSMAKTITGLLIGIAIDEGLIRSIDQPAADFLPEFDQDGLREVTIYHLLTMSSGLSWEETYISPLSHTTEAYYGDDLRALVSGLESQVAAGAEWRYKSGDSQLLGLILRAATGKTIAEYASEKLWIPLGAAQDASWSIDAQGVEKAYCCFNSNARDLARLGLIFLNEGRVGGQQIVSADYVRRMGQALNMPSAYGHMTKFYGLQTWVVQDRPGVYYARGILGQYLIMVPEHDLVIVRLGKHRGERVNYHFEEVYALVDALSETFR
jgi:CubicO group peptidase (beta-lactamase class C family)